MRADRKRLIYIIAAIVVVLILAIVLAVRLGSDNTPQSAALDTTRGVEYIKALEAKAPENVEHTLKQQREAKIQAMREQRLQELESGEISVWTLFEDYVILGDSRAVGFYYFEFLPEERVLAEAGSTIQNLQEHIPDIEKLNPSNIFLCYGLNDVSIGIWPTPADYVADYRQTVQEILAKLPDATVYISSILPARDPAFDTASEWREIPTYSAAVKEMCNGIDRCYYVDNDSIAEKYADLWEVDGIHVQKAFYDHWAANLIAEVYNAGLVSEMNDETE